MRNLACRLNFISRHTIFLKVNPYFDASLFATRYACHRDKDWEPEWFPSWEVAGLCGDLENVRREFWTTKVTEDGGKLGYRVSSSTSFTAKIVEKMDLEEFPFDIEDLTVSIRLACGVGEAHFVRFADEKYPLVDMADADVSLSEYFPYPDIPFNFTLKQKSARGAARSTLLLQINMVRSQKYYFFNVVSLMLLLTTSVACSWTMDTVGEDGQGSRIGEFLEWENSGACQSDR